MGSGRIDRSMEIGYIAINTYALIPRRLSEKCGGELHSRGILMFRLGNTQNIMKFVTFFFLAALHACGTSSGTTTYHHPQMNFAAVKTVAVLPFDNLSGDRMAGERVRDTFTNSLLATGSIYVLPTGEVARGLVRASVVNPTAPTTEEVIKLGSVIKVDALITGVVNEYGTLRAGNTSANVVSISLQMIEVQTGKVVWSAASTKGGISTWDRLFGGGGQPMNDVTTAAVDDIINKLFQ
jgi:hypothetical protein